MDDEKYPFFDDENEKIHNREANEQAVTRYDEREPILPSSPTFNTPNFKRKLSSTVVQEKRHSSKIIPKLRELNSGIQSCLFSEDMQSDSFTLETPTNQVVHESSPARSEGGSDDDLFASQCGTPWGDGIMPSAINTLMNGPEYGDLSWTSSMATPLASNLTVSTLNKVENLNTEERKVLLPSADCVPVRPRALFTPDPYDTTDGDSLNMSSDPECFFSRGEKTDKTPIVRRRRRTNSCSIKINLESPLAADVGPYSNPPVSINQEACNVGQTYDQASRSSPILSGSSEYKRSLNGSTAPPQEEGDMFESEGQQHDASMADGQFMNMQDTTVAESTPTVPRKRRSISRVVSESSSPLRNEYSCAESSLGNISVSTLEKECKAQELEITTGSYVDTPDKQSDSMRKRQLFTSKSPYLNSDSVVFKVPDSIPQDQDMSSIQDKTAIDSIPDDSFMEHMAAMSTSIFTDSVQPVTKMQSIRTSVSCMKKFCYSVDQKDNANWTSVTTSLDKGIVLKEIINSVLTSESSVNNNAFVKPVNIKPYGNFVVFSQLQEEMKQGQGSEETLLQNSVSEKNGEKLPSHNEKNSMNFLELHANPELLGCDGFQTASGSRIELSQEAMSKGFSILKGALEENCPTANDTASLNVNQQVIEDTRNIAKFKQSSADVSDDQVAEEVKQLLQLVSNGEDFDPWHEIDQTASNKKKQQTSDKFESLQARVNVDEHFKTTSTSPPCGFSTASGKDIFVSEKNIAKATQLLKECEDGISNLVGENSTGYEKNKNKGASLSKSTEITPDKLSAANKSNKSTEVKSNEELPCHTERKRLFAQTSEDQGCITPSKKARFLPEQSKSSHLKGEKLECSLDGNVNGLTCSVSCRDQLEEKALTCNDANDSILDDNTFKIPQRAMEFMNKLLDCPRRNKEPEKVPTASKSIGSTSKQEFGERKDVLCDNHTASLTKTVMVHEAPCLSPDKAPHDTAHSEYLERGKDTSPQPIQDKHEVNESALFTTASGKSVNVSIQALNKVKNLFDDCNGCDDTVCSRNTLPKGFLTASGREVNISEEAITKAEKLFADIPPDAHQVKGHGAVESKASCHSDKVTGFQAASGNKVTVSKQAVSKAVSQFEDISLESDTHWSPKNVLRPEERDSFNQSLPHSALMKPHQDNEVGNIHFSTAKGRKVDVLEQSLNKVKGMFDDLSSDSKSATLVSYKPGPEEAHRSSINRGSSIASGKPVIVSEEALKRARGSLEVQSSDKSKMFLKSPEQLSSCQGFLEGRHLTNGFATASGKTVSISKTALNKAKKLFDADNLSTGPSLDLEVEHRCVTENDNTKSTSLPDPLLPMVGFSTAGGREVKISQESLKRAQKLFDESPSKPASVVSLPTKDKNVERGDGQTNSMYSPNMSVPMVGFSTAGGREVKISQESLKKAQKLFDESPSKPASVVSLPTKDNNMERGEGETNYLDSPNMSVPMVGFSTAGGRAVHASEKALSKAKNFFEDLPFDCGGFKDQDVNILSITKVKARSAAEDDSGFFMSYENTQNTPNEPSLCKSSMLSRSSLPSGPHSHNANKENESLSLAASDSAQNSHDVDKRSLTQEISASTAAFLADGEFFDKSEPSIAVSKARQTINTSPSMVTDRHSGLKPILSSAVENVCEALEQPTSPILVKSNSLSQRRKSRRGRLSLSTNSSSRSTSPTFGSQAKPSSQNSHRKPRLSLPSKSCLTAAQPDDPSNNQRTEAHQSAVETSAQPMSLNMNSDPCSNPRPSRKLFVRETTMSSAAAAVPEVKSSESTLLNSESAKTPVKFPDTVPSTKHQTPLMRTVLTRNRGPQSSGFKTPYKSPAKEHLKRQPSSPAHSAPEPKRRRPSTNLYVSHINHDTCGPVRSDAKALRPEVAEMRRRASEEQKQLVENCAEDKGELLRPCVGSWLASKLANREPCAKLVKLEKMGCPQMYSSNTLLNFGLNTSTLTVTSDNAVEFRFSAWDFYSEDVCRENVAGLPVGDGALLVLDSKGMAGVEEFERAFLASPGVDPSLVPLGWVQNQYRWLVWKLAALEWKYPSHFSKQCLTPHMLMLQLKYRYDREIDRCERPALRRILEQDDSAAKRLVLCVAGAVNQDSHQAGVGLELELTDGWYSMRATIDQDMQSRVRKGIISVGTKLIMHGAELINCSEGCSPLQMRPEVRLKLCSNSTRRTRWYTKLGFQDNPGPIKISLGSVLSSGGVVGCVTVYVARVYPLVFMEKIQDKTVVRSQRVELKEASRSERKRQQLAESVYSQVQTEIQQEQTKQKRSGAKISMKYLSTITSAEELFDLLESSSDPLSLQNMLNPEQKSMIAEHQHVKQEEIRREMEDRVRSRLSENSSHVRQVTPILRVRVLGCDNDSKKCSAILSVWRPAEDVTAVFKEGQRLTIFGAVANGMRCGELQLSGNRSTRYHVNSSSDTKSDLLRTVYPLSSLLSHGTLPQFGELDIVGFVVKVGPLPQTVENTTRFQTAYISDAKKNIIGVSFWGGLKEFGVEDLILPNSFVAASNLQWRPGAVVKAVPCVFASELSLFTTNPRRAHLQTAFQELRQSIPTDLKAFGRGCEERLDSLLLQKSSSPMKSPKTPIPTVPSNFSELNSMSASPDKQNRTPTSTSCVGAVKAQRKLSMDHLLKTTTPKTGLSPAVQSSKQEPPPVTPGTCLSPAARLAKLEAYGEPPPISPILISNPRRSIRTQFKPPRKTDSPSAAFKKLYKSE